MQPNVHYDPNRLSAPMADKSTVRMLFSLKALRCMTMEHLDLTAAFLHEPFTYPHTVYVREPKRSNGSCRHGNCVGILRGNLYGGKSAGNFFLTGLFGRLFKWGYQQSDVDPCLFFRHTDEGLICFSVSKDDFLAVTDDPMLIDTLYNQLSSVYTVKRLGAPTKYLGWEVRHIYDGSVRINQAMQIDQLLSAADIEYSNGRQSPFPNTIDTQPPAAHNVVIMYTKPRYQELVGHISYLAHSTRPDLAFPA